jgi:hypothetical protein
MTPCSRGGWRRAADERLVSPVVVLFVDTRSSAQAGCAKPGLQSKHNQDYNGRITGTTMDAIRVGWGGPGRAGAGRGAGGRGRAGAGRAGGRGCGRGVGRDAGAGAGGRGRGGAGGLSGPDPVLHPDRGRMLLLKNRDYIGHCLDQLQIACCCLQPGVGVVPT